MQTPSTQHWQRSAQLTDMRTLLQVWFPTATAAASGTHFEVDVKADGDSITYVLDLPPPDTAPASGVSRNVEAQGVLDQSFDTSNEPIFGETGQTGSQFGMVVSFPVVRDAVTYVPTAVSVALFAFDANTNNTGRVVEVYDFAQAEVPGAAAKQWTWESDFMPVRCMRCGLVPQVSCAPRDYRTRALRTGHVKGHDCNTQQRL